MDKFQEDTAQSYTFHYKKTVFLTKLIRIAESFDFAQIC